MKGKLKNFYLMLKNFDCTEWVMAISGIVIICALITIAVGLICAIWVPGTEGTLLGMKITLTGGVAFCIGCCVFKIAEQT